MPAGYKATTLRINIGSQVNAKILNLSICSAWLVKFIIRKHKVWLGYGVVCDTGLWQIDDIENRHGQLGKYVFFKPNNFFGLTCGVYSPKACGLVGVRSSGEYWHIVGRLH
jgi:hypothetical protein